MSQAMGIIDVIAASQIKGMANHAVRFSPTNRDVPSTQKNRVLIWSSNGPRCSASRPTLATETRSDSNAKPSATRSTERARDFHRISTTWGGSAS
jgi:hypothetical protein